MRFIFSITKNNVIGIGDKLACHIPHDLKWFKMNTYHSTVVMGYNTFKSLKFKPLKHRTNLVVSSRPLNIKTIKVDEIEKDAWVIGGARLFESIVKPGDILYLTHIDVEIHHKDNVYLKLPKLLLLWKSNMFEHKSKKYYFACYKVV
tara:strand:- start:2034 stop:2474 length:441 start_codon:yes stop_codon:yes gene_type:complete